MALFQSIANNFKKVGYFTQKSGLFYSFTKKTVSKATFIVIALLDRAIQETLKTRDCRLCGNDGTWGLTYGPFRN